MKVLHFLFLLGVCFTIFEFIWGIFKLLFNLLTRNITSPIKTNSVQIIKYILFSAVTVQFIQKINGTQQLISSPYISIGLGATLLSLYLIGKFQNKTAFSQIKGAASQLIKGFNATFDPKLELVLIVGTIAFFIMGSIYPFIVDNAIVNWFNEAIINIYDTPFFGFIFMIIAGFVLMNSLSRGASIIGKLISGQSFKDATKKESPFQKFNWPPNTQKQFGEEEPASEPEFTEYEDVTEEVDD